ncbi:nucleotidyltransferase domain-containing protein [Puniceicoccaceae bacterium K14]|nr:nucleotidyltransferase domain-containing protein [Puniceicoccaceae bacterium K14]
MRSLEELLAQHADKVIFESVVGSQAYGTALPHSDEDLKGIYIVPEATQVTLDPLPTQVSDAKGDTVYYTLARFLELALTANPNIIELLFMPEECVKRRTHSFDLLAENRSIFITKQAYESHVGYAQAQIKKARGQNKWVNNPQPKTQPTLEDFCWLIPNENEENSELPYRPRPIASTGFSLSECHVAALEHSPSMYRIYHYGSKARGVIRGGKVVCESIPIDDEKERCIGLLSVNQNAFERAVRDHKNYWTWRENRNEARWQTQESGQIDYDAKNMMHTFRLLLSGESILRNGYPIVRFKGEALQFLMDIRTGKFTYDALIEKAETKVEELKTLHQHSILPEAPNKAKAEELLKEITSSLEKV